MDFMPGHKATIQWKCTGPDFLKGRYSREHTWTFDGGVVVPACPDGAQCDELYSFVFCREIQNKLHLPEIGEQYTFLGVDRRSKLILSHIVGKRDEVSTDAFMADLRKRVKGWPQITTDGFPCYRSAIENSFGDNVHFAQQVKQFADGTLIPKIRRRMLRS